MNRTALIGFGALVMTTQSFSQDWRAEADARIRMHRMADYTLRVVDATGTPRRAQTLRVEQTASRFQFGTCLARPLLDPVHPSHQPYTAFVTRHFNSAVDENHMKWYSVEKLAGEIQMDGGDAVVAFCREKGLRLRGHCLFWAREKFVQDWVKALDEGALRRAVQEHLTRMVSRYRGAVTCWDVNNEMLNGAFYETRLPGVRVEMFRQAAALDPDVPLFVNEYGILGGGRKLDRYLELVRGLQAAGAPVGGLGIQEHACERFTSAAEQIKDVKEQERVSAMRLDPAQAWRDLDRLAELGLPIHLTEVSCKTADPQARAEGLDTLLRLAYAHPAVEAVLLWGFWEKAHWLGKDAALVDADWELTPAGERVSELLLETWRTRTTVETDDQGVARFRGFHGTYRMKIDGAGEVELVCHPEQPVLDLVIP